MENVSEPSTVGALTGLLARLEGYTLATGVLDPAMDGGAPMVRERQPTRRAGRATMRGTGR
eukprot:7377359-Prymnesium_polylepis.1